MPIILDGKKAREALKQQLIGKVKSLSPVKPHLAIIQVGKHPDSVAYIAGKKKFAAEIGAVKKHIELPERVIQPMVMKLIDDLNEDPEIHGIIVQLPLPPSLDKDAIMNAIAPDKDVDALSAENVKKWSSGGRHVIWPATTRGIKELLHFYNISLTDKKVTIIGRSSLVGKPTAAMCEAEKAIVTVGHRQTLDLAATARDSDILIVAAGSPGLIGPDHVHEGQIVVDVGTTRDLQTRKLVGDVSYDAVAVAIGEHGAITPVPGGVGQMTVLALFENLVDACYNQNITR